MVINVCSIESDILVYRFQSRSLSLSKSSLQLKNAPVPVVVMLKAQGPRFEPAFRNGGKWLRQWRETS